VTWARKLADGGEISRDKAVKMSAWLARHESDKSGKGYNPGEDGYPSPGRVAWALWGGDPAVGWSAKMVNYFEGDTVNKADYTAAQRKEMAGKGEALPDGSFPIANEADLMAAMQSIGRAKNPARAKRHIKRRAKALGLTDKLTPAFQKAADSAMIAKGYPVSRYDTWNMCYDPPDLPIPCTPADLTPTMSAAMPPEMQNDFCARWNALAQPLPAGAGVPDDMAYGLALDLTCQQGQWFQQRDGSYVRLTIEGQEPGYEEPETEVEKSGRMLSAANHATMHEAATMIEKGCGMMRKMMAESGNAPIMPPAEEQPVGKEHVVVSFAITKVDPELRQVSGFAYVAKDATGTPVTDHSKDVVDIPSILKAIHENFGKIGANDTHEDDVPATMIESAWIDHPILKSMGAIPDKSLPVEKQAPDGGWWTTWQISKAKDGDQLWSEIQSGEKTAFSIEGTGYRTPIA
jgi:hypothetical protein